MGKLHDPVEALALELAGNHGIDHRHQAFLRHTAGFGVSHFAYVNTGHPPPRSTPFPYYVETNYPEEWVRLYVERNYVAVDPVPLTAQSTPLPFQWRQALAQSPHGARAQQVFDDAATFGIHDGYTVPIHAPAGLALMSMAVVDPTMFEPGSATRRQTLHLLALHFHLACERCLAEPPSVPASLPKLTPREREVLLWTAKGKTGWEIARILNLTERTVTYHIENAKAKLGATSRSQAVVVALGMGLITP
ncbi:MAG TPA: LuxR family transcriptional regulator [Magnetospirillum sp.]|nr:LuxR family transcriptional regulator [Magnetospirillum sp.]